MPELPDVNLYINSLYRLLARKKLNKVVIKSPFILRTFDPPIESIENVPLVEFSRIENKIVWHFAGDLHLVIHLMIAGRFHWRKPNRLPVQKNDLVAFQFDHGTIMLTEASQKKRAAMYLVKGAQALDQFRSGGIEILESDFATFAAAITSENRTLKRALTDQAIFSGIGNAYSDEILHSAKISPFKRTRSLTDEELTVLYREAVRVLKFWSDLLIQQNFNKFPEKVTAFRPEMAVHGKFGEPCPDCKSSVQRIRYADNECNYCATCQTNGKLLADRSLSRLLKDEWPNRIDELD